MRIFLIVLVILFSKDVSSQIIMKNEILVTPDSAVAYVHIPNLLYFWGLNTKKEYTLICEGDTIRQTQQNGFLYIPKRKGNYTLDLYKKKKLIGQFGIRAELLKSMTVQLGDLKDSIVTKYDLLNNLNFNVTHFPQLKDPCTFVIDFDMQIKKANGDTIEFGHRDSIQDMYYSNLSYLEALKYEFEEAGKDVSFLEKYIEDAYTRYQNEPMFNFEEVATIASMQTGDILFIPMVTLQCPSCVARKFGVNLKYIIQNE